VESLEKRQLLASISGLVWNDTNGNASRGAGEPALPGVVVYLDANDNGSRDAGETFTSAAADGTYSFPGLVAGNYIVREEVPADFDRTFPTLSGARLFATYPTSIPSQIVELNPATGGVVRTLPTPAGLASILTGLAFDGQTLFFLTENDTLYRLNPDAGAILGSNVLPPRAYDGLAAMGGFLYALDSSIDDVLKLDPATGAVLGTFDLNAVNSTPPALNVWNALGEVPATNELISITTDALTYDNLVFVNAQTGAVTHGLAIPDSHLVNSLTSVGDEIFVGYTTGNRIDVYRRDSAIFQRSLTTSSGPYGLGGWGDTSGAHRLTLTASQNATGIDFGDRFRLVTITGTKWDNRFEVTSGQLQLKAEQSLNFEAEPTVNLTITARDAGGLELAKPFTITVTNVNEGPTNVSLSGGSVAENVAGAMIGAVSVSDLDAGDSHTFLVSDSRFEVALGQLQLKPGQSLDFEAASAFQINLTAQDAGGLAVTRPLTINVTDRNDPPAAIGITNQKVRERISGEAVGALSATDQDAGQTLSFAVDDARFEIVGALLKLKDGQYLDQTLGLTVTITVTATDSGTPPTAGTQAITIDVQANPHPWQNSTEPLDTNNDLPDHAVVPLDALIIFNLLNNPGTLIDAAGRLPVARPAGSELPFYDPSGDGFCTSLDALLIINDINNRQLEGEGESLQSRIAAAPVPLDSESPILHAAESQASSPDLELVLSAIAEDIAFAPKTALRRRFGAAR